MLTDSRRHAKALCRQGSVISAILIAYSIGFTPMKITASAFVGMGPPPKEADMPFRPVGYEGPSIKCPYFFNASRIAETNSPFVPFMATPVLSLSETNSVDVMFTGKIQARLSASIICKDSANPSAPRTYDTTIGFLPAYIESAFPTDVWSSSVRCRGWIWASSFRFACFRASIWVSCKRLISTLMGQRKATHASSTAIPVATKAVASFFTSVGGSGSTSLSRYTPIKIAAAEYTSSTSKNVRHVSSDATDTIKKSNILIYLAIAINGATILLILYRRISKW